MDSGEAAVSRTRSEYRRDLMVAGEVRAGWEHRAADVVLREAVRLPQQCVAGSLEIPVEIRLR
jgi:hypothetical protein